MRSAPRTLLLGAPTRQIRKAGSRHLPDRVGGTDCPRPLSDGHLISHLVLGQVAEAIGQQHSPEQAVVFLEESGIDLDRIPAPPDFQPQGVADVLTALERWDGSDGRRVLRGFLRRWLSGQLHSCPDDELRRSLLAQLARQGWHVRDRSLVTGDPHATDQAPGDRPGRPGTLLTAAISGIAAS